MVPSAATGGRSGRTVASHPSRIRAGATIPAE